MLYSYNKQFPQELPFRITLDSGLTLTEVNTFSIERLRELGFAGPFEIPNYNPEKETISWTGDEFIVQNISSDEIKRIARQCKDNYVRFYDLFYSSELCDFIEAENTKNYILELHYLKFKLLEQEIRSNFKENANIFDLFHIQIFRFYDFYPISNDLKIKLDNILFLCNLDFMIPNPNTFCEFKSWVLQEDGIAKKPPIPYPQDGKKYKWDEELYENDNTTGWVIETL